MSNTLFGLNAIYILAVLLMVSVKDSSGDTEANVTLSGLYDENPIPSDASFNLTCKFSKTDDAYPFVKVGWTLKHSGDDGVLLAYFASGDIRPVVPNPEKYYMSITDFNSSYSGESVLTVKHATGSDSERHWCDVSVVALPTVYGSVDVIIADDGTIGITLGSNILTCKASGFTPDTMFTLDWTKDGVPLSPRSVIPVPTTDNYFMATDERPLEGSGTYHCCVSGVAYTHNPDQTKCASFEVHPVTTTKVPPTTGSASSTYYPSNSANLFRLGLSLLCVRNLLLS